MEKSRSSLRSIINSSIVCFVSMLKIVLLVLLRTKLIACSFSHAFIYLGYASFQIIYSFVYDYLNAFIIIAVSNLLMFVFSNLIIYINFIDPSIVSSLFLKAVIYTIYGILCSSSTSGCFRLSVYEGSTSKKTNNNYLYYMSASFIIATAILTYLNDSPTICHLQILSIGYLVVAFASMGMYFFSGMKMSNKALEASTNNLTDTIKGALKVVFDVNNFLLFLITLFGSAAVFAFFGGYFCKALCYGYGYDIQIHNYWLAGIFVSSYIGKAVTSRYKSSRCVVVCILCKLITIPLFVFFLIGAKYHLLSSFALSMICFIITSVDNSISFILFNCCADTTAAFKTLATSFINSATIFSGTSVSIALILITSYASSIPMESYNLQSAYLCIVAGVLSIITSLIYLSRSRR